MHHLRVIVVTGLMVMAMGASPAVGQRQMERLGRGVVAINTGQGVFVSWRMLGTDPDDVAFNLYRQAGESGLWRRLNDQPIGDVTWFMDATADLNVTHRYAVEPIIGGQAQGRSAAFVLAAGTSARPYLEVPLQTPDGYTPNDGSVGDLDGDGEYEIVIKMEGRARDNAHRGETDPVQLHAYKLDGTLLWTIDLGMNIRAGAHYTQFMVYDFDGDGRAEVACKTADGTVDGTGEVLGDATADHRNEDGYVLQGPEYLTVFDGLTGRALDTVTYIPQRAPGEDNPSPERMTEIWGDGYGNRMDRFLACVAYLDGERPSLVMCRGYYSGRGGTGRTVLAAWNFRDKKLEHVWTFDTLEAGPEYVGQGNHQVSVADVDGDGRDEIIYGSMTVDDDGTGLYSTGLGHGDALHVSDMLPSRPGLEVFMPHESPSAYGSNAVSFRDARTGEVIWGVSGEGDIGRGVAMDIDPRWPGYEMWASSGIGGLYTASMWQPAEDPDVPPRGVEVSANRPGAINFGVWWDGDLLREVLDSNFIDKWDWQARQTIRLLTATGSSSNNGTKATPTLSADILGDWREEVIWRRSDNNALRIYTTIDPTDVRLYTLMHDPKYRLDVAWQNVAYNQPPHPGFFLGHDMALPPRPNIYTGPGPDHAR